MESFTVISAHLIALFTAPLEIVPCQSVASSGGPTVLRLPDGQSVDPMRLSADEIDAAMGLKDLIAGTEIEVSEGTEAGSDEGRLQDFPEWVPALLIFCLFVVGGILGVGLIWVGLFRGRRKLSQLLAAVMAG